MKIGDCIRLRATTETGSVQDYYETVVGLRPCSNAHPPSLKNPTPVVIPMSSDGWERGAKKSARKQAEQDLMRLIELGRRQIGIPQGGIVAPLPQFPSIDKWV